MKLFSMCSIYSKDKRPLCACFLSKDKKVVEDMKKLCSDGLMWSSLGSGVISLYDLENEIYNKRTWDKDGTNDKEFICECQNAKIKVFSVIFTAQGYEIGITLSENEEKIIEFGRGNKTKKFWGLQEFYEEKYPKIFKGWKNYFDDFFYNEDGKKIENFLEESACRNIHNEISHCFWTQETEKYYDTQIFLMCKNSPYWMRYLKKMIEMHIDAGVDGILFDETASPYETGVLAGFCKHCIKKFADFLTEKYGEKYKSFDYRKFLRRRCYGLGAHLTNFKDVPYGSDFFEFQLTTVKNNFKELADYARNYAKSKKREIKICGNFGELMPYCFPLSSLVDVFNLELMFKIPPKDINTPYLKLARVLAKDKPATLVPSIFNAGYLRNKSKKGSVSNLEKYYIAETASCLTNYQIPYSCFTIEGAGSYYPDVEEIKTYQSFLNNFKELYNSLPIFDVYLVFSFSSYLADFNWINYPGNYMKRFVEVEKILNSLHIPYEILLFGDGKYLEEIPDIKDTKPLILVDNKYLTLRQLNLLKNYKYLIYTEEEKFKDIVSNFIPVRTFSTNLPEECIVSPYQDEKFINFHIVNCQYEERNDNFIPLKNIKIEFENYKIKDVLLYSPDGKFNFSFDERSITLDEIKIYSVMRIATDDKNNK